MNVFVIIVIAAALLLLLASAVRIVKQYEQGVLFRLGRVVGVREPGLRLIVPVVDVLRRVALQLRNLQSLVEIGVDKNTTVVFPAPLMSTIGELGSFLARESAAAAQPKPAATAAIVPPPAAVNGTRADER